MDDKLLENVPLRNTTLSLNPDDLKKFDELVGKHNRSREVRELIREFNNKERYLKAGIPALAQKERQHWLKTIK